MAMICSRSLPCLAITVAATLFCSPVIAAQSGDGYAEMLDYLATSRIDGRAFVDASGAVGANLAAGDHNLQSNLRSFASGGQAAAFARSNQQTANDHHDTPTHASATIGGLAFGHASGLVSINQASGSGNAETNLVAAALAHQGIRESTDGNLLSAVSASAGGQTSPNPDVARPGTRNVAVESTAMQGFEGILQLNQIAGSGNSISNQLALSVDGHP
ncbi:hypothetical protein [Lysobacter sp. A03]|uniref:hypothetical protein n=1 Tax=Lysobacter sp. A03 TaxID=1199154 RepID=UPI0005B6C738|nr:hypothetical protein [Lysobacter sp. A03]KIQ96219.1 Fap amyloid fibril minor component [Lysobacter sp. A03]